MAVCVVARGCGRLLAHVPEAMTLSSRGARRKAEALVHSSVGIRMGPRLASVLQWASDGRGDAHPLGTAGLIGAATAHEQLVSVKAQPSLQLIVTSLWRQRSIISSCLWTSSTSTP